MRLSDFDYDLPDELIAQYPCKKRDDARLMVINRLKGAIEHKRFGDIVDYLGVSDSLVLNDTKVIKARLAARRMDTGAKAVLTLIERLSDGIYKCLIDASTKIKVGVRFIFGEGKFTPPLYGTITASTGKIRVIEFNLNDEEVSRILNKIGEMPLPPYIKRRAEDSDEKRYQTVYARNPGAIAAPTAGLHFTEEILKRIRMKGVGIEPITLHVGYGTFKPVSKENIREHELETEYFEIKEEISDRLNYLKSVNGRVFAVGTTTCRVLEHQAGIISLEDSLETVLLKGRKNRVDSGKGWTNLFIYPPYSFKFVDGLITNFHLPKTTLLMLAAAFCGKELLFYAYKEAVKEKYRFYSYGDAMLIL